MENTTKHTTWLPDKKVKTTLYDDVEDMSNPHKITILPTTPSSNSIVDLDGKTVAEYSKETATQRDLTQPQEHFE